jgi:curved DNA-binding protein CbpA
MSKHDLAVVDDPWAVLGLAGDAGDEEIRAAYLAKVKEHPPDRSPEQFERIRDAYDLLRDPRRRAQRQLLWAGLPPTAKLVSLLPKEADHRRFVGPLPWRAVLRGGE